MFDSVSLEEHLVFVEVVVSIFSISKHLEWASTTIKKCSQGKAWQNQYGFAARVTMAIPMGVQVQY